MRLFRAVSVLFLVVLMGSASSASAGPVPGGGPVVSVAAASGFVLPTPGPASVLTPFRAPATRYGRGHRGVDLGAAVGTPVVAAGDGTVVFAGELAGRGVVSIDHPIGLRTTYEPITASVTAGRHVTAGTVIGTLEAGHGT